MGTPALGTVPILAPSMLGQLSLVSATHTTPTVELNLRTASQAMSDVARASVVAPGAAVSTAACTAPRCLVPGANTEISVKPSAGTMPMPNAANPTQVSLVGSVLPAATLVSVPPVVTSDSAVPVVTTVQATSSNISTSVAPVATAAPAAPIIVVKQPQPTKPYTGQTSWKSYKEYFTRLALCNGWTTGVHPLHKAKRVKYSL